jgi:hypothetical protein
LQLLQTRTRRTTTTTRPLATTTTATRNASVVSEPSSLLPSRETTPHTYIYTSQGFYIAKAVAKGLNKRKKREIVGVPTHHT